MVREFIRQFHKVGPLTISEVQYDDYNLSLMGAGWSLNTTSSWRILSNDGLFGNHDGETKEIIKFLIGETIASINEFGEADLDFTLSFGNGNKLQVFSNSYFEPWIFNFDGQITLVAGYPSCQ